MYLFFSNLSPEVKTTALKSEINCSKNGIARCLISQNYKVDPTLLILGLSLKYLEID